MREFLARFKKPTPIYWKNLGTRALIYGMLLTGVSSILYQYYPDIEAFKLFAVISATFAIVSKILAENTVKT